MTVKTILKWLDMLTAWGFVVGFLVRKMLAQNVVGALQKLPCISG
ncbi:TPA: hypothetical protein ACWKPI_004849 [Escherichia coli]